MRSLLLLILAARVTAFAADTLPEEYAIRWLGADTSADGITRVLDAASKPDDPYDVEFWTKETDPDGHAFFFRLRKERNGFVLTKKVRGADDCPYRCTGDDGEEKREVDVTYAADRSDPLKLVEASRVCSTSCDRSFDLRPSDFTRAPRCAGGSAHVERWTLDLGGKKARVERWERGEDFLWELSAKSKDMDAAAFAFVGRKLLKANIRPLACSKQQWMCDPAACRATAPTP